MVGTECDQAAKGHTGHVESFAVVIPSTLSNPAGARRRRSKSNHPAMFVVQAEAYVAVNEPVLVGVRGGRRS